MATPRKNLVKNSSFRSNSTGWVSASGSNVITSIVSSTAFIGSTSLFVSNVASSVDGVKTDTSNLISISPSITYSASVYVSIPTITAPITNVSGNTSVITYTSANTFIAGQYVTVSDVTPSGYNVTNAQILSANATAFTLAGTSTGTYSYGGLATVAAYNFGATALNDEHVKLTVTWLDASKSSTGTPQTVDVAVPRDGSWYRIGLPGIVSPPLASYASISILRGSGATLKSFYVDAVLFEPSTYINEYYESLESVADTVPFVAEDKSPYDDARTQALKNTIVKNALTKLPEPYISGLKLRGDININGLILNKIDENNVIWVCTDIKGWWDLPEPMVPNIQRGLDDGSYYVRGKWLARDLTLEGSILPPNPDYMPAARDILVKAIQDLVYLGGWIYVDEAPMRTAYVYMVGRPSIEVVNPRGRINFSIALRAGDPIKYGWDMSDPQGFTTTNIYSSTNTGGSITITNIGNTKVDTTFIINGPLAASTATAPTQLVNTTNGGYMKIIKPLRAAGYTVSTISSAARNSNVATITALNHGLFTGDVITISGLSGTDSVGNSISSLNATNVTVTAVTSATFSYASANSTNLIVTGTTGTATLRDTDTLVIDTYNQTVLYRGIADAGRSVLDTNINWIALSAGDNIIKLETSNSAVNTSTTKVDIKYKSGWIG
jgi:hypothetical protein